MVFFRLSISPLADEIRGMFPLTATLGRYGEELLKTNAIYQEVYNSQTQGGGDFDKQGGEQ